MAKWTNLSLKEVIREIERGRIVLPVIQRELVWETEKISALFETILKGESFGGVMTVIDPANREPLFEFRKFICNYQYGLTVESQKVQKLDEETTYVIDGQQRLSAFYIGVKGSYNNESLYFDLYSEHEHANYNFAFSKGVGKLPRKMDNYTGTEKKLALWCKIVDLYVKFEDAGYDYKNFCDDFCHELDENMTGEQRKRVDENLYKLQAAFFNNPIIGLCGVPINRNYSTIQNRLGIVKLFQKLNQGGTILSGLELMRSVLKAYSAENETFLNEVKNKFIDIGFNQDEIIKLVFLLQDDHTKDITDIDQSDSDFISKNGKRIKAVLEGTRNFLKHANLYEYFIACKPSSVPLPFIAYHLFHSFHISDDALPGYFDNSETINVNFGPIRKWLIISTLNRVWQRGNGWNPNTTGRKKILDVLKKYKGEIFPSKEMFDLYKSHPLHDFDDKINDSWEWLNWYDRSLIIYLLYGKPSNFRQNDIDHIHPRHLLEARGVENSQINLLGNFQYLYFSDNRSKQAEEFGDWMETIFGVDERKINDFLSLHTVPSTRENWYSSNYNLFLEERRNLIFDKISKLL